jgi:RNase P subunit RPR2
MPKRICRKCKEPLNVTTERRLLLEGREQRQKETVVVICENCGAENVFEVEATEDQ